MFRKILIGTLITGMMLAGVSTAVFAKGDHPPVCAPETNALEDLGMTREEVKEALDAGQTLEDLFTEAGLDYAAYVQEYADAQLACIEAALEEGTISEEQAERMTTAIETALEEGNPLFLGVRIKKQQSTMKIKFASFENIAETFGMTTEELREAMAEGQTLVDIADELGVDLDVMVEEWVNAQIADIEQAVADGKMTQEQADALIERMNDKLEEGIDFEKWNPIHQGRERAERVVNNAKDLVSDALEALGMTAEEVREAVAAGQTIEEIAAEQGVDLDALYDEWLAEKSAAVEAALANGEITEEQAQSMLERIENQAGEGFLFDFLGKVRDGMKERGSFDGERGQRPGGMNEGGNFPFSGENN